eukprot:5637465-Pyramimonas_sp.AAC.1
MAKGDVLLVGVDVLGAGCIQLRVNAFCHLVVGLQQEAGGRLRALGHGAEQHGGLVRHAPPRRPRAAFEDRVD